MKIGYLSGDLHMHAVGLLTPELFELHDRSKLRGLGLLLDAGIGAARLPASQRQRILQARMDHHVRLAGVDDVTAAQV